MCVHEQESIYMNKSCLLCTCIFFFFAHTKPSLSAISKCARLHFSFRLLLLIPSLCSYAFVFYLPALSSSLFETYVYFIHMHKHTYSIRMPSVFIVLLADRASACAAFFFVFALLLSRMTAVFRHKRSLCV